MTSMTSMTSTSRTWTHWKFRKKLRWTPPVSDRGHRGECGERKLPEVERPKPVSLKANSG